jgi:hypothetical protein
MDASYRVSGGHERKSIAQHAAEAEQAEARVSCLPENCCCVQTSKKCVAIVAYIMLLIAVIAILAKVPQTSLSNPVKIVIGFSVAIAPPVILMILDRAGCAIRGCGERQRAFDHEE